MVNPLPNTPLSPYQAALLQAIQVCAPGAVSDRMLCAIAKRHNRTEHSVQSALSLITTKRPDLRLAREKSIPGYRLVSAPVKL